MKQQGYLGIYLWRDRLVLAKKIKPKEGDKV